MPRFGMFVVGLVVLALAVTACGDTPPPSTSAEESQAAESPAESQAAESTAPSEAPLGEGRLADVQDRGHAHLRRQRRAGRLQLPGRGTGENAGFDVDFCRAVAAAVLGDPDAVEFRALDADQRGPPSRPARSTC